MGKFLIPTIIAIIIIVSVVFSGLYYYGSIGYEREEEWYEMKIAEYFSTEGEGVSFPDDWIRLLPWEGNERRFAIYSYDPDDPVNEGICGGWAGGNINTNGRIYDVMYS